MSSAPGERRTTARGAVFLGVGSMVGAGIFATNDMLRRGLL